jgi:TPR repeat protein
MNDKSTSSRQEDICCICLEQLPICSSGFKVASCCGKGYHNECVNKFHNSNMTEDQKKKCPHCQTKLPTTDEEHFKRTIGWANKGKAWAQYMLGSLYARGKGVEQSSVKAVEYYTKAADQGHASAQSNLGVMYLNGESVEQSDDKAIEYFDSAAEQGELNAISNLDVIVKCLVSKAEKGNLAAQKKLGIMYYIGNGVKQSYTNAIKYCTMAAEQNDKDSIELIAEVIPIVCVSCNKMKNNLKSCPCKSVYYCNKQCQKIHWNKHKGKHRSLIENNK